MYDPDRVRSYYNGYGDREWNRLIESVGGRVEFAIALHVLGRHLPASGHILDVGGGPGRYTIRLAEMGYTVTLADISDEQLVLARRNIEAAGVQKRIAAVQRTDVCDLGVFDDASFDAVVCLGGALSYVREGRDRAIEELIRVAKPKSVLAMGVMSLVGTMHLLGTLDAKEVLEHLSDGIEWHPGEAMPQALNSNVSSKEFHLPLTMYSSEFLRGFLEEHGCQVLDIAATRTITSGVVKSDAIASSPEAIERLIELEKLFCDWPGAVDMGPHLLAVVRTPG